MTKHLLGIWCVVTAAACGGGGGSVAADDLISELYDVQCETATDCGQFESDAACHASIDPSGGAEFQSILAAIDKGTITYDEDKAGDCIDLYRDQSCEFTGFHDSVDTSVCDQVFTGTVALGGACMISEECAGTGACSPTDTSCDPETACCPGTCVAGDGGDLISQEGGPCNDDMHTCDSALYCSAASSDVPGTCAQPIAGEGSACTDVDSCANPMYCDVFSDTPTCVRPPSTGETCDPQALLVCADSRDYCDATMKCARAGDAGATCASDDECLSYASCINGACVAQGGPGATCGGASDPDCAGDLECTNGTCALPPAGPTCSI
jgi:hypothetical protein